MVKKEETVYEDMNEEMKKNKKEITCEVKINCQTDSFYTGMVAGLLKGFYKDINKDLSYEIIGVDSNAFNLGFSKPTSFIFKSSAEDYKIFVKLLKEILPELVVL